MVDFSYLKKLDVDPKATKRYVFEDVRGAPYLDVLPATEANAPYYNEMLRRNRRFVKATGSRKISKNVLDANRETDKEIFLAHVIKGGGNFFDTKNKKHEFSVEVATAFIHALPNWMFDDFRVFCMSPASFTQDELSDEEVAGN